MIHTTVTFKTKLQDCDGSKVVKMKKLINKSDCCGAVNEHDMSNADFFWKLLNRAYRDAIDNKYVIALDKLPDGVTVDDSKFLAVVTVRVGIKSNK